MTYNQPQHFGVFFVQLKCAWQLLKCQLTRSELLLCIFWFWKAHDRNETPVPINSQDCSKSGKFLVSFFFPFWGHKHKIIQGEKGKATETLCLFRVNDWWQERFSMTICITGVNVKRSDDISQKPPDSKGPRVQAKGKHYPLSAFLEFDNWH